MRIDVLTIFPRMIDAALSEGIVARARERGVVDIGVHDLRDYTADRHRTVDDVPYGGGPGMVMKPEPVFLAFDAVVASQGRPDAVLLMTPQGQPFTHEVAAGLSRHRHVAMVCGRYEGIDERVAEGLATQEISIGDYVLSGGELPALVVIDAVTRLLPGAVGDAASVVAESFAAGLLDCPHYTRPAEFRGRAVPDVLLSGHHGEIERWRRREQLRRTLARRPDLLDGAALDDDDRRELARLRAGQGRRPAGRIEE